MLLVPPVGWKIATPSLAYVGGAITGWLGTASTTTLSLTGLTGGLASAPAAGDLVVVVFALRQSADVDLALSTAGYTELADVHGNDTIQTNLGVYRKLMSGSPDTQVQVGSTSSATCGILIAHVWRGANQTTPIDVATTTANGINTGIPNPPSITPTTSGAVVLAIGAASATSNAGAPFTSSLSNLVSDDDGSGQAVAGIASHAWTSGAYDPPAFGITHADSTLNSWAAATVAIRPA
jgi:hypothetical protein